MLRLSAANSQSLVTDLEIVETTHSEISGSGIRVLEESITERRKTNKNKEEEKKKKIKRNSSENCVNIILYCYSNLLFFVEFQRMCLMYVCICSVLTPCLCLILYPSPDEMP